MIEENKKAATGMLLRAKLRKSEMKILGLAVLLVLFGLVLFVMGLVIARPVVLTLGVIPISLMSLAGLLIVIPSLIVIGYIEYRDSYN